MAADYSSLARRLIEPPYGTNHKCYFQFRFAESYSSKFVDEEKQP